MMKDDLKSLVGDNEKIMWEGKPNKKCFIFECIFNPLLPFAMLWAFVDLFIFGFGFSASEFTAILIPFFLLHMMPVWIYLIGALSSIIRYKNTYYIVTDYAVYFSSGVISKRFDTKPFQEMSRVNLHRGIFDQMFNVGDIVITTNQFAPNGHVGYGMGNNMQNGFMKINSISDYTEVYNLVKKLQKDMYADTMYPNDMRPEENHGYNTKYKG